MLPFQGSARDLGSIPRGRRPQAFCATHGILSKPTIRAMADLGLGPEMSPVPSSAAPLRKACDLHFPSLHPEVHVLVDEMGLPRGRTGRDPGGICCLTGRSSRCCWQANSCLPVWIPVETCWQTSTSSARAGLQRLLLSREALAPSTLSKVQLLMDIVRCSGPVLLLEGQGQVQGSVRDGVARFLGLRYATADRWRPPRPLAPWPEVLPTRCLDGVGSGWLGVEGKWKRYVVGSISSPPSQGW